ncbi:cohesin domain-containing protein [Cnuibacter physcomitrellae]|uniref:cohesin domain-containing protein n=1 Tax=Cnuibacter physcomitrellae TaxID=1619308 RepID=UPI002175E1AA|nr:cohesin domain-containing protein [Cnuibacter physcomitrellae]MCS5495786.1 cohesin domain-containing protein [Cnuibacter physcomitrellae]
MHSPRPRARRVGAALAVAGAASALTLLTALPASAAPTVAPPTLSATANAAIGDTIDVSIALPATTDVYAYELQLAYDPALLDYVDGSLAGPAGGFDSATESPTGLTVLHSRLGTSPALSGDLAVTLELTAVASGTADLDLASVVLVDAAGASTPLTDVATSVVVIAAPPVTVPDPGAGTPGASATATPTPTTVAAAAGSQGGDLASTGLAVGGIAGIVAAAVAAVAAGLLVWRRAVKTR